MTRKHISVIETAINRPSLDTLVDIANALNVSADDLLVDSLTHSASTADSEIHRLLLDCNTTEQEILTPHRKGTESNFIWFRNLIL